MDLIEKLTQDQLGKNYMLGTVIRDGLHDLLERETKHMHQIAEKWERKGLEHLYLVGCGGSRAVLEPAKWLIDKYSRIPVDTYSGWEFFHRSPMNLDEHAAVVLGSHSGTTEEILLSMELAQKRGAATLSFSQGGTKLTQQADDAMVYQSPATNLSKLLMNYMVANEMMECYGDKDAARELRQELQHLPEIMHKAKEATEERGKALAVRYKDVKGFYLVATGLLSGLAYQFATCNLLEMQWKHASVWNSAEFFHGPLEIVEQDLPMIVLLGKDETRPVSQRILDFVVGQGADVIALDLAEMGDFHPWLAPFGLHLPLQWLISYMGAVRGHPISTRRYMGLMDY